MHAAQGPRPAPGMPTPCTLAWPRPIKARKLQGQNPYNPVLACAAGPHCPTRVARAPGIPVLPPSWGGAAPSAPVLGGRAPPGPTVTASIPVCLCFASCSRMMGGAGAGEGFGRLVRIYSAGAARRGMHIWEGQRGPLSGGVAHRRRPAGIRPAPQAVCGGRRRRAPLQLGWEGPPKRAGGWTWARGGGLLRGGRRAAARAPPLPAAGARPAGAVSAAFGAVAAGCRRATGA
jgi:hypothetical protein